MEELPMSTRSAFVALGAAHEIVGLLHRVPGQSPIHVQGSLHGPIRRASCPSRRFCQHCTVELGVHDGKRKDSRRGFNNGLPSSSRTPQIYYRSNSLIAFRIICATGPVLWRTSSCPMFNFTLKTSFGRSSVIRGLTLGGIRRGYYITPFVHRELTQLTLGKESGRYIGCWGGSITDTQELPVKHPVPIIQSPTSRGSALIELAKDLRTKVIELAFLLFGVRAEGMDLEQTSASGHVHDTRAAHTNLL
ncbi:hypothetical protein BDZ89DRAFT_1119834 [Hymenopellis radicata]|nr:hypothetical protein BDZ89DRAFT_1119834 [Hymenopellis radicata]